MLPSSPAAGFFFFNDTATTEIYTLSLHDALPIYPRGLYHSYLKVISVQAPVIVPAGQPCTVTRSEEHTSELQSRQYLVCRLLLEKKKSKKKQNDRNTQNTKKKK